MLPGWGSAWMKPWVNVISLKIEEIQYAISVRLKSWVRSSWVLPMEMACSKDMVMSRSEQNES